MNSRFFALALAFLLASPLVLAQVSHPASELTPGTFSSGDYRLTGIMYYGPSSAALSGSSSGLTLRDQNGAGVLYVNGGNVGIGNAIPGYKLDVNGEIHGATLRWGANTNYISEIGSDSALRYDGKLLFAPSGVITGAIDSSGNVGIGTTSPGALLEISQDIASPSTNGQFRIRGKTNGNQLLVLAYDTTNNNGFIRSVLSGSGSTPLKLQASRFEFNEGNVGIGITPARALDVNGAIRVNSNGADDQNFEVYHPGIPGVVGKLTPYSTYGAQLSAPGPWGGPLALTSASGSVLLQPSGGAVSIGGFVSDVGSRTTLPSGSDFHYARLSGETSDRFRMSGTASNGIVLNWGSGSAATDTNLYRSAANALKTDGSLFVGGQLNVGGQGVLTVGGTPSKISVGDLAGGDGSVPNLAFRTNDAERVLIDGSGGVTLYNLPNCNTIDTDANGKLTCGTDAVGGGVTSISQGTGMSFSSNPIMTTGTISLNTAAISSCTGSGQKIIWDSSNGRLTCGTDVDTDTDHHDNPASHAATGNIDANGYKVTSLAAPTANGDAATKAYVDAQVGGTGGTYFISAYQAPGGQFAASMQCPSGTKLIRCVRGPADGARAADAFQNVPWIIGHAQPSNVAFCDQSVLGGPGWTWNDPNNGVQMYGLCAKAG